MKTLIAMFSWVTWDNTVALWWIFISSVSVLNILFWFWTWIYFNRKGIKVEKLRIYLALLSAVYVFVCAYRSFLPRADVQRICLFDTWFSSVLVGRSLATFAELAFIAQWALVLNQVSKLASLKPVEVISKFIFPLIFIAECFSWYAVITTHYLGNTFEESIWGCVFALIAISLLFVFARTKGAFKFAVGMAAFGSFSYVLFMAKVDVPMYYGRWMLDAEKGKPLLGFVEGFHDLNTRWVVTHDIAEWKTEIPWMSLYFSIAVWTSLALCYIPLTAEKLRRYLKIELS